MPHFKEFIDPNYLCNVDFLNNNGQYDRKIVTITKVTKEEIHNGKGGAELVPTVHLAETKPFVLSKKNLKTILRLTKQIDTDNWIGCRIELFIAENIKAFGNVFDVIRVADKKIAPVIAVDYSAQEAILRNCLTLEELRAAYTSLTPAQQLATVNLKDELKKTLPA